MGVVIGEGLSGRVMERAPREGSELWTEVVVHVHLVTHPLTTALQGARGETIGLIGGKERVHLVTPPSERPKLSTCIW